MAKPRGWDDMSDEEKRSRATDLVNSMRGHYILGQALAKAVAVMREVKPHPEYSNIEDMEMLGEALFNPYYAMYAKTDTEE